MSKKSKKSKVVAPVNLLAAVCEVEDRSSDVTIPAEPEVVIAEVETPVEVITDEAPVLADLNARDVLSEGSIEIEAAVDAIAEATTVEAPVEVTDEVVVSNLLTGTGVRDVLSYEPIEGTALVLCKVRRRWRKPGSGVVMITAPTASLYATFEEGLAAWRAAKAAKKAAA